MKHSCKRLPTYYVGSGVIVDPTQIIINLSILLTEYLTHTTRRSRRYGRRQQALPLPPIRSHNLGSDHLIYFFRQASKSTLAEPFGVTGLDARFPSHM